MEYLPTITIDSRQMLVNIPYMDPMGKGLVQGYMLELGWLEDLEFGNQGKDSLTYSPVVWLEDWGY